MKKIFNLKKQSEWNTDWLENPQNTSPENSDFIVDLSAKPVALPAQKKNAIMRGLHAMGDYFDNIPFTDIEQIFRTNGVVIVQEDGTPWSGFIAPCGECGTPEGGQMMFFDLAHEVNGQYVFSTNKLAMTACSHAGKSSRNVEVIKYIG